MAITELITKEIMNKNVKEKNTSVPPIEWYIVPLSR